MRTGGIVTLETNAPAFIETAARQALDALDRGDLKEAREILADIQTTAHTMVEWFKRLSARGCGVPADLTWTAHLYRGLEATDEQSP
jgi:hypothetical protein